MAPSNRLKFIERGLNIVEVHGHGGALIGEFYREVDGFYVWLQRSDRRGFFPAWLLRSLADKLDALNAEWERLLEFELGDSKQFDLFK